jgi:hypothetical protein
MALSLQFIKRSALALLRESEKEGSAEMADQKTHHERMNDEKNDKPTNKSQTGDPGRTPSKAEGDRDTIEQDLRHKERERQLNEKS